MNREKTEHYKNVVLLIIGIVVLFYFFFSKLLMLALPFFISWGVAFAVRPLARKLSEKTKIPHKWISLALSLLAVLGVLALFFGVIIYAAREAWAFLTELAASEEIYNIISKIMNPIAGIFGEHEGAAEIEERISEAIRELISSFLSKFVSSVSGFVSYIPGIVIFLFISIVSTVYFSLGLENINQGVKNFLPKSVYPAVVKFKNRFLIAALSYARSYLTIMLIVFSVLLAGFLILKSEYALLLSVVFALLDMLPLIGIGTFMVPWAIFEIAVGDVGVGVGLIVLFIVTEIVRNLLEPKIVGKNLGVHPILTLVLLYASFYLFGFAGLLLTPIFSVILNIVLDKNNSSEVGELTAEK